MARSTQTSRMKSSWLWIGLLFTTLGAGPAACPPLADPPPAQPIDEPGPYATASYEYFYPTEHGTAQSTIVYPTSIEAAPFPAIVMAPGYCAIAAWQTWVGNHLASHGYVVLTFTDPTFCVGTPYGQDEGARGGFAALESESATPGRPIFGLVDSTRRGIIGHSMGAGTATQLATEDPNVLAFATMGLGGLVDSAPPLIGRPMLLIDGNLDCQAGYTGDITAYEALYRADRQLVVIAGGNHSGFTDEGSLGDVLGPALGDCERTIQVEDHQHRLARRYFTAWFDWYLKGDAEVLPYLGGEPAQADLAAGLLTEMRAHIAGG